jgi:Protein of unknown function (DUF1585)/Protein of unknown function (DUF1588)
MAAHRANPECATCHASMDPLGFAFEHFDAVGRWRDDEGGLPIEDASFLPDGTEIDGIDGVKRLLLASPERFVGAVTEKLLMYALGRNVQYYDKPVVRQIVRDAAVERYAFAALVRGVAKSLPFRMRQAPEEKVGSESTFGRRQEKVGSESTFDSALSETEREPPKVDSDPTFSGLAPPSEG